ncbi:MAG: hypothetical protein ACRCSP_05935 [Rhodoglobus sp.]
MTSEIRDFLHSLKTGARLVVRYRLPAGSEASATDALGFLMNSNDAEVVITSPQGPVTIALADIVAAKKIPPAPERRR